MLSGVVGELNHQQVSALTAASDAVDVGDVGALGCRPPQEAVHLGIGGVGKLDDGTGLLWREAGERLLLSSWRRDIGRAGGRERERRRGGERQNESKAAVERERVGVRKGGMGKYKEKK